MYWLQDDYERCAALLESCLERLGEYPPSETIVARTTFMTQLSYALSSLGDFDSARDLLVRVNEESEERTDPYNRARLYWSLARLSGIQGNLPAALNYVRRSITLLETTEDNVHLARAHLLCGQVFNLDESAEQAIVQLTQAERLFGERIDSIDLGHLRSEQSKALSTFGEAKQALAYAQEAVQRLDSDLDYLSSAWHALAKALALAGDIEEACRYYEQAVDQLEKSRSDWREAAQACHEWALVLKEAGRREAAARAFGRAAEITRRQAKAASLGRTAARA
jgi:tetratricopeptide (TPR) repeat protein